VKDHASIDTEVPSSRLEHQPIGLALTLDHVGMRRSKHDVDGLGMGRENLGQRIDDVLDPLVW
jgi:hypothetical protein